MSYPTARVEDLVPHPAIAKWRLSLPEPDDPLVLDVKRRGIVEPILDFDLDEMIRLVASVSPEVVWVGYDNWNCKLPEPPLWKTQRLIEALRALGFDVRVKTFRRAWWERP